MKFLLILFTFIACNQIAQVDTSDQATNITDKTSNNMSDKVIKTDDEWKNKLSDEEYRVLREKGTERPFTGKYYKGNDKGVYVCAGCGAELFNSLTKYDSGCGWPAFYAPISEEKIKRIQDANLGMLRTEIICAKCDGHLGHVFDDGPQPTGERHCINSISIKLVKEEEK